MAGRCTPRDRSTDSTGRSSRRAPGLGSPHAETSLPASTSERSRRLQRSEEPVPRLNVPLQFGRAQQYGEPVETSIIVPEQRVPEITDEGTSSTHVRAVLPILDRDAIPMCSVKPLRDPHPEVPILKRRQPFVKPAGGHERFPSVEHALRTDDTAAAQSTVIFGPALDSKLQFAHKAPMLVVPPNVALP